MLARLLFAAALICLALPGLWDNSYPEGALAARAWDAARGLPVYQDWREWPHAFAPYSPLTYYLPAWAGVGFGMNELRWSPRIRREDGLLRLVPGLGTRAVDRLADDYPVLAAPGQPELRVNISPEDVVRYSPRKVDVIDLRNIGLVAGIELEARPGATGTRGFETFLKCFELGVMVRSTADTIALSPPLIVEKAQIDQMFETLGRALRAVQ
jgi:hypothetical protein